MSTSIAILIIALILLVFVQKKATTLKKQELAIYERMKEATAKEVDAQTKVLVEEVTSFEKVKQETRELADGTNIAAQNSMYQIKVNIERMIGYHNKLTNLCFVMQESSLASKETIDQTNIYLGQLESQREGLEDYYFSLFGGNFSMESNLKKYGDHGPN